MRILVVEDNAEQRDRLVRSLEQAHFPCPICREPSVFHVTVAENEEEAVAQVADRKFEFALVDPVVGGKTTEHLERVLSGENIPHAYYTDRDTDELKAKVPEDTPVLVKTAGLRLDLLSRIMDVWLEKHRHKKSNRHRMQHVDEDTQLNMPVVRL